MADAAAMARPRLGVLGGSFDPPHIGHLVIASEACDRLSLERAVFVPAANPPHKDARDETAFALRLAMTEAATTEDLRFNASAVEAEDDLRYTVDTLAAVAQRHPRHELVFVMGSDSLLQFDTWKQPEMILGLAALAVALRPGDDAGAVARAAARWGNDRVTMLDAPVVGLSSTSIRERVRAGRSIRYLVPQPVAEFIVEHRLYRGL